MIRTRSSTAVGGTLAVLALSASLVSGCGTSQPGAAAVVGDRRISVTEVQSATADILQSFPGQEVPPQQVLFFLISGPFIIDAATRADVGVSDSDARRAMTAAMAQSAKAAPSPGASGQPTAEPAVAAEAPSDAGVAVYRANSAIGNIGTLDQAKQAAVLGEIRAALGAAHIEVNPRYGRFDPVKLTIGSAKENWIATPSASPVPVTPQDSPTASSPAGS